MGEAGPAAPVLSLQSIDAGVEQASVVDLSSYRDRPRTGSAAATVSVGRPESDGPAARVAKIRAGGQVRRRRSGAPPSESATATDLDVVLGSPAAAGAGAAGLAPSSPDATGADAPGLAPGATGRRSGRGRASTDRRSTQRPSEPRPATVELKPDADPIAVAREICLRLLTDRARTRQELAQALQKRGVPDDAAGAVLERFDEVGLIDDAAFADQWVRSRHTHRGLARRAIAYELRRKGVADEVAQEALTEVDAHSEELRARELVDHKLRSVPADTPEQRATAARRLVGMLARKGYPGGTAYRVVREALAAHGADIDDELGAGPDE